MFITLFESKGTCVDSVYTKYIQANLKKKVSIKKKVYLHEYSNVMTSKISPLSVIKVLTQNLVVKDCKS